MPGDAAILARLLSVNLARRKRLDTEPDATMPLDQMLLLLLPIVLLQLTLLWLALRDLLRRPSTRGPKWVWGLVIVLFAFVGPLLYFVAGREP